MLKHNGRRNVPIVLFGRRILSKLCARIPGDAKMSAACRKTHTGHYVDCAVSVVYEMPLDCGKSYIGQTGQCVSDQACELSLTNDRHAHLPHCALRSIQMCAFIFKVKGAGPLSRWRARWLAIQVVCA